MHNEHGRRHARTFLETVTEDALIAMGLPELAMLEAAGVKFIAAVAAAVKAKGAVLSVEVQGADLAADASEDLKFKPVPG